MKRTRDDFAQEMNLDFGEFDDPAGAAQRWITILRHLNKEFIPELHDLSALLPDVATIEALPIRSETEQENLYGILEDVDLILDRAYGWEHSYLAKAVRGMSDDDKKRLKKTHVRPRLDLEQSLNFGRIQRAPLDQQCVGRKVGQHPHAARL